MNSRARFASIAGPTALIFVVAAVWWIDFLYSDACLDAGGRMEGEVCVGARHPLQPFWSGPWTSIALSLFPPAIGAAMFFAVAWATSRGLGNGDA